MKKIRLYMLKTYQTKQRELESCSQSNDAQSSPPLAVPSIPMYKSRMPNDGVLQSVLDFQQIQMQKICHHPKESFYPKNHINLVWLKVCGIDYPVTYNPCAFWDTRG